MRRARTLEDWFLYVGVALLALILAAVIMMAIVRASAAQSTIDDLRDQIEELTSAADEQARALIEIPVEVAEPAGPTFLFPIHPEDFSHFTSPFGERDDPLSPSVGGERINDHGGVDAVPLPTVWDARVRPAAPGVVAIHWPPKGRPVPGHPGWTFKGDPEKGAWIEILHDNGWRTQYLHLSWTNPDVVREGLRVDIDDTIGRVGGSGRTTGSHLHFTLIDLDGNRVNPILYLQGI